MTSLKRILWFLLRGLGVPEGQSPTFYKDLVLGAVFVPAAIVMLLNLHLGQFSPVFWTAFAVSALILLFAPRRAILFGGLFVVAAVRLLVGFVVTLEYQWLVGACACAGAAFAIVRLEEAQGIDRSR